MTARRRWHLKITDPISVPNAAFVAELDIGPRTVNLRTTTAAPGGFAGMTCTLKPAARRIPSFLATMAALKGFQHVELSVHGEVCWAGRIQKIQRKGGTPIGFVAVGYGVWAMQDDWFGSQSTGDSTAAACLRAVISTAAILLGIADDPDEFVDSGIPHVLRDFDGMTPADVVNFLSTEGGSGSVTPANGPGSQPSANSNDNAPYDFTVWGDRRVHWKPRVAPLNWIGIPADAFGARYWIDLDESVEDEPDFTNAVSDVYVETTPTGGLLTRVGPAVDTTFVNRYGIQRAVKLKVASMSVVQAAALGQTYLALHKQPVTPVTIRRTNGRGLALAPGRGADQAPELVWAGDWVQIADQGPYFILTTELDWVRRDLTVNAQSYPDDYWQTLATLEEITRVMAMDQNVLTGQPNPQPAGTTTIFLAGSGDPGPDYEGMVVARDGEIGTRQAGVWKSTAIA